MSPKVARFGLSRVEWRTYGRQAWEALGAWFFPEKCECCGVLGPCSDHPEVRPDLEPRCRRCARRLPHGIESAQRCAECQSGRFGLARMVCVGSYQAGTVLSAEILAFKHGGRADLAVPLGRALAQAWEATRLASGWGSESVLVPVPLHRLRLWQRGYDQAALLAEEVSGRAQVPWVRALYRTRPTAPQGSLAARSRGANVAAAFAVHPDAQARFQGRFVWLVDDVCTSGATLRNCAQVLRRAGAKRVGALVVARAEIRAGSGL